MDTPTRLLLFGGILMLGVLLVHSGLLLRPEPVAFNSISNSLSTVEGFSTVAVDPVLSPACTNRSADAQSLLAQLATLCGSSTEEADEFRLLISKLCCMEADISTPSKGSYRTLPLQFRTSQDTEPPATIVGRCLSGAVNKRDIEIIIEKYKSRGLALIKQLGFPNPNAAASEFDTVVGRLQFAMTSFCLKPSPTMDHPQGARDMGFWEPDEVADLSQYQGISAVPK